MAFTTAQRKSLAIGFGLIAAAATVVVLIWLGTYLPGFAGEIFSVIAGLMWTPIILDLSLFLLGVILILWLNAFIRAREGDEYVYLEQVEGPDVPADLPAEARAAVFREAPAPRDLTPTLAAIEGALDLDDTREAADLLYALPEETLETPEVLALRITLAENQGHHEKARELRNCLRLKSPLHPAAAPESGDP